MALSLHPESARLFAQAQKFIPGGVNSPVRAFKAVGGHPLFIERGQGCYVFDADGNRYIDYIGSFGPLILGHAPAPVLEALMQAARDGTSFGAATAREVALAERVANAVPSVEMVRFVNSGTEATMSALRLARAFTGRDGVIQFAGCYHGHADAFLAETGSGVATLGIPGCAGVTAGAAQDTITLPYNDLDAVAHTLARHADCIAALIVEPVACNMGLVRPLPGFLAGLRSLCHQYGVVLIFDEVITGFRLGLGGAQEHFGVPADLTTFGKIIGGGLPVGAYGGRRDIMQLVAPVGPVYQAGTLAGNPLAMAAGLATLEHLAQPHFFPQLNSRAGQLEEALLPLLERYQGELCFERLGSIFYLWLAPPQAGRHAHAMPPRLSPPTHFAAIKQGDCDRFGRLFHGLLKRGVLIAPSAFEVAFLSAAHDSEAISTTAAAFAGALEEALLPERAATSKRLQAPALTAPAAPSEA